MIPRISSQARTNYAVHILRSQNTESVEPELKKIGKKPQYNNELIPYNTIIYARGNQIADMIQVFGLIFQESYKMARGRISTLSLS